MVEYDDQEPLSNSHVLLHENALHGPYPIPALLEKYSPPALLKQDSETILLKNDRGADDLEQKFDKELYMASCTGEERKMPINQYKPFSFLLRNLLHPSKINALIRFKDICNSKIWYFFHEI